MRTTLLLFIVGCAAFWAGAATLAYLAWEEQREITLGYSATAILLCVLPSAATLLWALGRPGQSPEEQRLLVLGGTGVRMFGVLGAGLALTGMVPYFQEHQATFWIWVLVFYLFTLALEMLLVVRGQTLTGGQQK